MRINKIAIATVVACGISGFAFADGITAESGVYVTGQAGWSFADAPDISNNDFTLGSYSYSETPQNYVAGATVGYDYALTQNWMTGVELGYLYMGQNKYAETIGDASGNQTLKNWGIQLMLTGTYVMPSGWNVFGKVGGIYQVTDGSGSYSLLGTSVVVSGNNSAVIPALAVGAGYLFTQNLNLAFQYEHTFGDNYDNLNNSSTNISPMTQNIVTLGLTYKFPL